MSKWPEIQLRRVTTCLDGWRVPLNSTQRAEVPGDYPYWGANGIVDTVGDYLFDEELVLLGEDGAPFGDPLKDVAFLVQGRVWVNNHIHVLRPTRSVIARFLAYALNTVDWPRYISGSTREKLTQDDMARARLPYPVLDKQRAIANFLDTETARIDALVRKKRTLKVIVQDRLVDLAHALTMTSGAYLPLRRVMTAVQTGTTPPATEMPRLAGQEINWFSPGDFGPLLDIRPAARRLSMRAVTERLTPRFPADSTLVVGIGATAGKVSHLDHEATGNQQVTCIVGNDELLGRFLSWQLYSRQDEIRATAPHTTLPIVSNEFLRSLSVFLPNLSSQRQIVDQLDKAALLTERLVQSLSSQIELLSEHRQALIAASVRGELDIPGVSAV